MEGQSAGVKVVMVMKVKMAKGTTAGECRATSHAGGRSGDGVCRVVCSGAFEAMAEFTAERTKRGMRWGIGIGTGGGGADDAGNSLFTHDAEFLAGDAFQEAHGIFLFEIERGRDDQPRLGVLLAVDAHFLLDAREKRLDRAVGRAVVGHVGGRGCAEHGVVGAGAGGPWSGSRDDRLYRPEKPGSRRKEERRRKGVKERRVVGLELKGSRRQRGLKPDEQTKSARKGEQREKSKGQKAGSQRSKELRGKRQEPKKRANEQKRKREKKAKN